MNSEKRRIFGRTENIDIDTLKSLFTEPRLDYIRLAVLFGSRASEAAHVRSDYDFAVLAEDVDAPWGKMAKIWNDVGEVTGLEDCDYDIVDLAEAGTAILNSIKENYILLKGDENELCRIFEKHR